MVKQLLVVLVFTSSVLAQTQYTPYLSVGVGGSYVNDADLFIQGTRIGDVEFDPAAVFEGAVGVKIDARNGNMPVRLEMAGFVQMNDVKSVTVLDEVISEEGDVSVGALLFNAYVDFPLNYGFAPYVLGGIGYTYVDMDTSLASDSDNLFCGQVGAGLGYYITEHIALDLGYKFFIAEKAQISNVKAEISAHQVMLGLRYEF